ncbi:MAG: hypothetical protein Q9166_007500 [cf. Caloplaca sp. 2 TL-2023]
MGVCDILRSGLTAFVEQSAQIRTTRIGISGGAGTTTNHLRFHGVDEDILTTFKFDIVTNRKYSLCIVQDDIQDWETEAQKMSLVYQYADLVIAATAAQNSSQGLFLDRKTPKKLPGPSSKSRKIRSSFFVRDAVDHHELIDMPKHQQDREPLTKRAWVLQEWLLARRVVQFSRNELLWDCRQEVSCECGITGLKPRRRRSKEKPGLTLTSSRGAMFAPVPRNQLDFWLGTIEEYTTRDLTKVTDKMIAISGLAFKLESIADIGRYICGLFELDLLQQLMWRRKDATRACPRPQTLLVPSWSWGSISDTVSYNWKWSVCGGAAVHIEDADGDQFGMISNGTLVMTTHALHVVLSPKSDPSEEIWKGWVMRPATRGPHSFVFTPDIDLRPLIRERGLQVLVAKLAIFTERSTSTTDSGKEALQSEIQCASLILLPPATGSNYYTRLGVGVTIPLLWYEEVEKTTLRIG